MKKIYLLIIALTTLVVSCSSDDSGGASNGPVLLKRYTNSSSSGALSSWGIEYDGNRQMKIISADGVDRQDYIYTNDLITNIKTFKNDNLQYENVLGYDQAGKLIKHTVIQDAQEVIKIDITYPSENVYVETAYINNPQQEVITTTYTLKNGNIILEESGNKRVEYEYDTKNVPKKNIHQSPVFQMIGFDYNEYSTNNCVSKTTYFGGELYEIITNDYTYNSDNYPTVRKSFYNGYLNNVTTFYYE